MTDRYSQIAEAERLLDTAAQLRKSAKWMSRVSTLRQADEIESKARQLWNDAHTTSTPDECQRMLVARMVHYSRKYK